MVASMLRISVLVACGVVLLSYLMWPTFPPGFEDPHLLIPQAMASKALNGLLKCLWWVGMGDPLLVHWFVDVMIRMKGNNAPNRVEVTKSFMAGVEVLVITPKNLQSSSPGPAVVYFHGGGYEFGSATMVLSFTAHVAQRLNCVLLSVEYRQAPNHSHPAAVEDAVAVIEYLLREGHQSLHVDPKRVAVAGDSTGAHLAASVVVKLGLRQTSSSPSLNVPLKAVGLIAPFLQFLSFNTPSYLENSDDPFIPRSLIPFIMLALSPPASHDKRVHYTALLANKHASLAVRQDFARRFSLLPLANRGPSKWDSGDDTSEEAMRIQETYRKFYDDPVLSPLFADLGQFPPTVILSAKYDIVRDDSAMMIQRLRQANRTVEHVGMRSSHLGAFFYRAYPPGERALDRWLELLQFYLTVEE